MTSGLPPHQNQYPAPSMFINNLVQVLFPAFQCFSPGSSSKEVIRFVAKQMSDLFDRLNN